MGRCVKSNSNERFKTTVSLLICVTVSDARCFHPRFLLLCLMCSNIPTAYHPLELTMYDWDRVSKDGACSWLSVLVVAVSSIFKVVLCARSNEILRLKCVYFCCLICVHVYGFCVVVLYVFVS